MPPKPTADPTAFLRNMSETVVKRLADQPWCAAVARLIRATATHKLEANPVNIIGVTHKAQASMAVFRALLTVQPRLMSEEESHPPTTLPRSAKR
jgi:hypothetical protein